MKTKDPKFPNRPNHPDFWRLSRLIIAQDKRAEIDQNIEPMVADVLDMNSLAYTATQRAYRLLGTDTKAKVAAQQDLLAKISALYLDAFLLGHAYAKSIEEERVK